MRSQGSQTAMKRAQPQQLLGRALRAYELVSSRLSQMKVNKP